MYLEWREASGIDLKNRIILLNISLTGKRNDTNK